MIDAPAAAQLQTKPREIILPNQNDVNNFLVENQFDYGVISWSTGNEIVLVNVYSGLFLQNKKWYLARIYSKTSKRLEGRTASDTIMVNQLEISEKKANILRKALDIEAALRYKQEELDELGDGCTIRNAAGRITGGGYLMDGGKIYLAEGRGNITTTRMKYAPDFLLKNCARYDRKYRKVAGLYGAWKGLENAVNKFPQLRNEELERFR